MTVLFGKGAGDDLLNTHTHMHAHTHTLIQSTSTSTHIYSLSFTHTHTHTHTHQQIYIYINTHTHSRVSVLVPSHLLNFSSLARRWKKQAPSSPKQVWMKGRRRKLPLSQKLFSRTKKSKKIEIGRLGPSLAAATPPPPLLPFRYTFCHFQ